MKTIKYFLYLIFVLLISAFNNGPEKVQVLSAKKLDANQITTAFTNYGFGNALISSILVDASPAFPVSVPLTDQLYFTGYPGTKSGLVIL